MWGGELNCIFSIFFWLQNFCFFTLLTAVEVHTTRILLYIQKVNNSRMCSFQRDIERVFEFRTVSGNMFSLKFRCFRKDAKLSKVIAEALLTLNSKNNVGSFNRARS